MEKDNHIVFVPTGHEVYGVLGQPKLRLKWTAPVGGTYMYAGRKVHLEEGQTAEFVILEKDRDTAQMTFKSDEDDGSK